MRIRRSVLVVLTALALCLALAPAQAGPTAAGSGTAPSGSDPEDPEGYGVPLGLEDADVVGLQTSDRVPGEIARVDPRYRDVGFETVLKKKRKVSGALKLKKYKEVSERGRVIYHVLRMRWNKRLKVDYVDADTVGVRQPLKTMLRKGRKDIIAGVNGDFFDISGTGAPYGLGKKRKDKRLRHGIDAGWNAAFYQLKGKRRPRIGIVPMIGKVKGTDIVLTNHNSPRVKPGGIGLWDKKWARTAGFAWTAGETDDVRMVKIRKGKVIRNRSGRFPVGKKMKRDKYLIARGAEASAQLKTLTKGTAVKVRTKLPERPQAVITGNQLLLQDGAPMVEDDKAMHPRTAIGIDRDRKQVLMVAVDGRSQKSRGYTMVELADLMQRLGAEDALNLDGGGSTTMIANKKGTRKMPVVNRPSDGQQRAVPNGLAIYKGRKKR